MKENLYFCGLKCLSQGLCDCRHCPCKVLRLALRIPHHKHFVSLCWGRKKDKDN